MDQNTQQTATNSNTTTNPPQSEQVIMGGAFGGTIPATQEAISETMPSFSFDEAEFGGPVQPVAATQENLLKDPFAGVATSTTISLDDLEQVPTIPKADIIESSSLENVVADTVESFVPLNSVSDSSTSNEDINISTETANEWISSFELPVISENLENPITENQSNEKEMSPSDISFDLPISNVEQTPESPLENISDNMPQNELSDISFDLPVEDSVEDQPSEVSFDTDLLKNSQWEIWSTDTLPSIEVTPPKEEANDTDFSLPSSDGEVSWSDTIVNPDTTEETLPEAIPTFDLPAEESPLISDEGSSPDVVQDTTQQNTNNQDDISFNIPSEEVAVGAWVQEELPVSEISEPASEDNNIYPGEVNSPITENIINDEEKNIEDEVPQENTQEVEESENDTVIAETTKEEWTDNNHALQESFDEFSTILNWYLSFLNTDTVTMIGLRTDEDEVQYTFTKEYDDTITIEKSNTGDIITFTPTESGLEVFLNKESIAYYGVDEVYHDTTHYLKEKLGKFTMMIESEHEKQSKAKKEEAKKIKETLRSF